jgi:hypothetical protein
LKNATEVLVTGSSAGAMGVASNLDRIAERLAPAKVKGLSDSAWVPYDMRPAGPGMFDVRPDWVEAYEYYNAHPDESCVAANPQNPGMCLTQSFAFPYIRTPMFVFADQRDPALLSVLGIRVPPQSDPEREAADEFARRTRESIAAVAPAYFLPDTGRHTVLLTRQFGTVTAGGEKLSTILHNWYFEKPGPLTAVAPAPATAGTTR